MSFFLREGHLGFSTVAGPDVSVHGYVADSHLVIGSLRDNLVSDAGAEHFRLDTGVLHMPFHRIDIILYSSLVARKRLHIKRIVIVRPASVENCAHLEIVENLRDSVQSVGGGVGRYRQRRVRVSEMVVVQMGIDNIVYGIVSRPRHTFLEIHADQL